MEIKEKISKDIVDWASRFSLTNKNLHYTVNLLKNQFNKYLLSLVF